MLERQSGWLRNLVYLVTPEDSTTMVYGGAACLDAKPGAAGRGASKALLWLGVSVLLVWLGSLL